MNEPVNDDLLPEHADIDADLAAVHRDHTERLATVLDLDAGLAAILTPDEDAGHDEPASAALASSRLRAPLPSGQATVIIAMRVRTRDLTGDLVGICARDRQVAPILARACVRADAVRVGRGLPGDLYTLADVLANARARARARARDLDRILADARGLADDLDRILAVGRVLADARGLADDLDRILADARGLADDLDRILADAQGLASSDVLDRPVGLGRTRIFADRLDRQLQGALGCAEMLVAQFHVGKVDASGADLSALDLTDMSVLEGIVWTEETTWPPGVREQVQLQSRPIGVGVYQVRGGSEQDPSELIVT